MTLSIPEQSAVDPGVLLEVMKVDLTSFLVPYRGTVSVCEDGARALEAMMQPPDGPCCVLFYTGETNPDENPHGNGVAQAQFSITCVYNVALTASPQSAKSLQTKDGNPSALRLATLVKRRVFAWRFPASKAYPSESSIIYHGCDAAVEPDGIPMAAYTMRFSLYYTIPTSSDKVMLSVGSGT